jgi:hypothetical protein
MAVFTLGVITGRTASIAVIHITEEMIQPVVYGIVLKVIAHGVITRCLVMYWSGVWIGMSVMLIPVIRLAI